PADQRGINGDQDSEHDLEPADLLFEPVELRHRGAMVADSLVGSLGCSQRKQPMCSVARSPARLRRSPSRSYPTILFSGYSMIPTAPARSSFGMSSRT